MSYILLLVIYIHLKYNTSLAQGLRKVFHFIERFLSASISKRAAIRLDGVEFTTNH